MEFVHIKCVAKKLTRVLKIVCYNPRKWPETDVFAKTHLQTLLARRLSLVLLCIKLWSVRGGGTVRVSKCIIMALFWASNSWLQRHMNGQKKRETCTLLSKNQWKPHKMSSIRSLCTSRMLQ
jgi:hypothetical protein